MKDFRLASGGKSYDLPGALDGVMNYSLFLELVKALPQTTPIVMEHLRPQNFSEARRRLLALL